MEGHTCAIVQDEVSSIVVQRDSMAGVGRQVGRGGENVVGKLGCEKHILEGDAVGTAVLAAESHNDISLARGCDGLAVGHPHHGLSRAKV